MLVNLPDMLSRDVGLRLCLAMVNLPDMLSRDVGLRLCLAMVELIWMDVSSL
jgi:hypothetical protein